MDKYLILLMMTLLCVKVPAGAQTKAQAITTLSLEECRQTAHDNYPVIKQYQLITQGRDYTIENAAKGWLPQLGVWSGGYAFTDLLKTNEQMNQMGLAMKNWMANVSVSIHQKIFDGGQITAQKEIALAQADVQKHQLDVTMYAINERIDQLYFGILLLEEQLRQNELLRNDLSTSEQTIRSMMRNGVANQSDLDAIQVEQLKTVQQKEALQESRMAYLRMLGAFMGKDLNENMRLEKPLAVVSDGNRDVNRPELSYYTSQNRLLDARRKQLDTRLRPTVSLFGVGMAHTHISDRIHNGLLAGGISVSWNIGTFYTRKNDIRKLEVQKAWNESQRETFLFNNRLQNQETEGAIASLRKQIAQDDEIVRLRERIRSKSDKKVQLGTESVNELVRDINAVSLARAQRAQHEIMLLKEIYKQKNLNNQ